MRATNNITNESEPEIMVKAMRAAPNNMANESEPEQLPTESESVQPPTKQAELAAVSAGRSRRVAAASVLAGLTLTICIGVVVVAILVINDQDVAHEKHEVYRHRNGSLTGSAVDCVLDKVGEDLREGRSSHDEFVFTVTGDENQSSSGPVNVNVDIDVAHYTNIPADAEVHNVTDDIIPINVVRGAGAGSTFEYVCRARTSTCTPTSTEIGPSHVNESDNSRRLVWKRIVKWVCKPVCKPVTKTVCGRDSSSGKYACKLVVTAACERVCYKALVWIASAVSCLPPETVAVTPSGPRALGDLAVGDKILTPAGFKPIYFNGHATFTRPVWYVVLTMASGHVLKLSGDHYAFTDGQYRMAKHVRENMTVTVYNRTSLEPLLSHVHSVGHEVIPGAFNWYVEGGLTILNYTLVSVHSSAFGLERLVAENDAPSAYEFLFAPLRMIFDAKPAAIRCFLAKYVGQDGAVSDDSILAIANKAIACLAATAMA